MIDDKEFVLEAVKQDESSLDYASQFIQDKEIVQFITELHDKISKCITNSECIFKITNKNHRKQNFIKCITCKFKVCEACAKEKHKNHKTENYIGFGYCQQTYYNIKIPLTNLIFEKPIGKEAFGGLDWNTKRKTCCNKDNKKKCEIRKDFIIITNEQFQ